MKFKEAEEAKARAQKALKTSVFSGKFKPNYLIAAPFFEQAAMTYKVAGMEDQAKDMYRWAADCQVRVPYVPIIT